MSESALIAVMVFALAFLIIMAALYAGASRSKSRGEKGPDGLSVLRLAIVGSITIYVLLAISALLD